MNGGYAIPQIGSWPQELVDQKADFRGRVFNVVGDVPSTASRADFRIPKPAPKPNRAARRRKP